VLPHRQGRSFADRDEGANLSPEHIFGLFRHRDIHQQI
jgi:hypothetical protein